MSAKKVFWTTTAGLTVGGAAAAVRRARARRPDRAAMDRWLTVTVNRGPGDIQPDKLPAPLQEYGERIETRIRPAPGDRGTELAVRPRKPQPEGTHSAAARLKGDDPRQDLRRALREAKALLEAGEVLQPDTPPTTHDTPGGKLIGLLSRRASEEGVL